MVKRLGLVLLIGLVLLAALVALIPGVTEAERIEAETRDAATIAKFLSIDMAPSSPRLALKMLISGQKELTYFQGKVDDGLKKLMELGVVKTKTLLSGATTQVEVTDKPMVMRFSGDGPLWKLVVETNGACVVTGDRAGIAMWEAQWQKHQTNSAPRENPQPVP